ncbi:DNA topoisomerase IV [Flagellimonas aquimarina]|uniref:DNA topoisomerase IV n=1 Tax=Flagellimonas aquimarina TaxID=2201895 RepID=A0A316LFY4_9FLAO|nr:DNA topoisomerase IV [Allomuricauda koreensis]PWL39000.1 DNA topoisomerase IV [Allomuricauda koreensis]
MMKQIVLSLLLMTLFSCNEPPQRNCTNFKTGEFSFTSVVNGEEKTTTFSRTLEMEVDYFEGKQDTSSVRWINDCEYVLKNVNPKSKAEEKSIHIKILTTSDSSYTFEYNAIGDKRKFKGTAHKIH